MLRKILILFFLMSCSTPNSQNELGSDSLNFDNKLTFNEFNELLEEYAKISPYPDLDRINMNKIVNIAVVGLGQVGIYLLNELNTKKKDIELKTGKKINIVAVSARNVNKKRRFKINKKIFYKDPLKIFKEKHVDILFENIGLSDGISKKVVETALKNKIHVITPNKALISKHGDYLAKLAEDNKVNLEFEASVAGGIPILRTIKEGLTTNKIQKFMEF